jgi:GTP cyclohydrolase I
MNNTEYVMSLSEDKSDPELGAKVCEHLQKLGLVPVIDDSPAHPPSYNPKVAVQQLSQGIASALDNLGLDVRNDPSLRDTPRRYANMLVGELTKGLNFDFFPKCTKFPNGVDGIGATNTMVFLGNIQTISLCEHHLQTIYGVTHIAYLPADSQIGLSKLARVVDFFARRPQVQERMTEQIYEALAFVLGTDDVAVVQSCAHYCMRARGALQHSSMMQTNKMGGKFMSNPSLRQEFLDACPAPISQ